MGHGESFRRAEVEIFQTEAEPIEMQSVFVESFNSTSVSDARQWLNLLNIERPKSNVERRTGFQFGTMAQRRGKYGGGASPRFTELVLVN